MNGGAEPNFFDRPPAVNCSVARGTIANHGANFVKGVTISGLADYYCASSAFPQYICEYGLGIFYFVV
jgi:hypothetical protein